MALRLLLLAPAVFVQGFSSPPFRPGLQRLGQHGSRTSSSQQEKRISKTFLLLQKDSIEAEPVSGQILPQDEANQNDTNLGRFLRGVLRSGSKDKMECGSIFVAKAEIPELGIWIDQSYELQSVYLQGLNEDKNVVEKIPLGSFQPDDPVKYGYTRYITLFSPVYHQEMGAVVVTPEEAGLVSLGDEVVDSIVVALPILSFWLSTCFIFASQYNQRNGGNFIDALLGR